jgi:hypothetical protein
MRAVRQQMLCFISPNWSGEHKLLNDPKLHQNLRKLLKNIEIVHFASIALLPNAPLPNTSLPNASDEGQQILKPSLMLELTVDEGISPQEVLKRLTNDDSSVLWEMYKNFWFDPDSLKETTPTETEKNAWLLNHLEQGLSIADGAYLGPRDRNVQQILQERELYKSAQKYAQSLPLWDRQNQTTFALKMARWAEQIPSFDWARLPAPRSFWRTKEAAGKIAYLIKLIAVGFMLLWIVQGTFKCLKWLFACLDSYLNGVAFQSIDSFLASTIQLFSNVINIGYRSVFVSLIVAAAFAIVFLLLPALLPPWRNWLNTFTKEIDRPSQTWSSMVTYAFAWLVVIGLVLVLSFCIIFVFFEMQSVQSLYFWLFLSGQKWLYFAICLYFALLGILAFVLTFGMRSENKMTGASIAPIGLRAKFQRWFLQPFDDETPRAQQVHPSIEACEAELVGNTAHMISLTDLRTPYWWNRMMAKISLRVVTFLGYTHFTGGRLAGAPGIQYSHWHLIDGGRRMLFCANFDGTFGGYLDDFIKGPSLGVNMFWRWTHLRKRPSAIKGHPAVTNARSFPPTRLWFFRGVKCELKFKAYARESMLPHLFHYEAINLSSEQKNRATEFRNALFGQRNATNDDLIMRVLET